MGTIYSGNVKITSEGSIHVVHMNDRHCEVKAESSFRIGDTVFGPGRWEFSVDRGGQVVTGTLKRNGVPSRRPSAPKMNISPERMDRQTAGYLMAGLLLIWVAVFFLISVLV